MPVSALSKRLFRNDLRRLGLRRLSRILAAAAALSCLFDAAPASAAPLQLGPFAVADVFATPGCLPSCVFPVDHGVLATFSYALTPGDQVTDILIEGVWGGVQPTGAPVEVSLEGTLVATCTAADPCITDVVGRVPWNGGAGFLLSSLGVDFNSPAVRALFEDDDATLSVMQTGTAIEDSVDLSGLQITVFVDRTCVAEICDGFDNDCDLVIDNGIVPTPTACGVGECSSNSGLLTCQSGSLVDSCDPFAGAVSDDQCDGLDNDCNGLPDDSYVDVATSCGVGECSSNAGLLTCQSGSLVDTCDPLAGAVTDDQCDGLDNDCNGLPDDAYIDVATSCGVGQCSANAGLLTCQVGSLVDTCDPFGGAGVDDQCDGIDNDCNGVPDDGYVPAATACGVGQCSANTGLLSCQAGSLVDTCDPFAGAIADNQCDGLDNDCDGAPDDDYIDTATSCGVGQCSANAGLLTCQAGSLVDTCDPLAGAVVDDQCDGLDNDCNGTPDDAYVAPATNCGVGQCSANTGLLSCQAGSLIDTCDPLAGALADNQCDGLDNDCDGTPDDDYLESATNCGVGQCSANAGLLTCQAGSLVDTCDPLAGAVADDQCDGLDDDCNGTPDDAYVAPATNCGVGQCSANTGLLSCQAGSLIDTCDPLAGAVADDQCDGLDNDCNGTPDDAYLATATNCGVGQCSANAGLLTCQAGSLVDTCDPFAGAVADDQCDGLDNDCDGTPDDAYVAAATSCGVGQCSANAGLLTCQAGSLIDTCDPLAGALADDQCDGVDNDCDGTPDDDYIDLATSCGVGQCSANAGLLTCQAGSLIDTCDPLAGAVADDQCDGLDNDCNGAPDDAYVAAATNCGVGECSTNVGLLSCQLGALVDTCNPFAGAVADNQCDGLDNDCDGAPDDDYIDTATSCGLGQCSANAGLLTCQAGSLVDTCDPFAGALADDQCDGLDNDCNGTPDDAYIPAATTCGVGECSTNAGILSCQSGNIIDTCDPIAGALPDDQCDGLDNDCNGLPDDAYVATQTTCGMGQCSANTGQLTCQAGSIVDTCDPLAQAQADDQCDGLDNDCDGTPDDDYIPTASTCGVGQCAANAGIVSCQTGSLIDSCDPLAGALPDTQCDGLDNDCDGTPDDNYIANPTFCGVGECSGNSGLLSCQAGNVIDTCDALAGALPDTQCDGLDNDCDGSPDDNYAPTPTTCGVGQCSANAGQLTCQAGSLVDTCDPIAGALPDTQCDGRDDDCDGAADDDYIPTATGCGVGLCSANAGQLTCQAGSLVDTCDPLAGAVADDQCDGLDNDCDGSNDEAYTATPTTCGVGECSSNTGQLACQAGSLVDTCNPLAGAVADNQCDALDNDCDGTPDDDYLETLTTCGVGRCSSNTGLLSCQAGSQVDTCDPLAGAIADDQCNGQDEDCDGIQDDDYIPTATGCGVGLCSANAGQLTCQLGSLVDTCDPLAGAVPDDQCDGLDNNCDGSSDEAYVATQTNCGVGVCSGNAGLLTCQLGTLIDTCNPFFGALADNQCDALDNDCDGSVDESYFAPQTACGVGLCSANIGALACLSGSQVDTCDPFAGAAPDNQCNAADEDCDGAADDDFVEILSFCGQGECAANVGLLACQLGSVVDTCDPFAGAAGNDPCDGLDNDCDGSTDEGFGVVNCGVGVCATSVESCLAGVPQSCVPLPGPGEEFCIDGLDDDCDGLTDDTDICDLQGFDSLAEDVELGQLPGQNLVLVAAQSGGMRILEFPQTSPMQIGSFDPVTCRNGFSTVQALVSGVAVAGQVDLVAMAAGLCGFWLADMGASVSNPTLVATFDTAGSVVDVALSADDLTLYVADFNGGLGIFDIGAPAAPQLRSVVGFADPNGFGAAIDVEVMDDLAYVATRQGLRIVDVANPFAPNWIGSFNTNSASGPGQGVEVIDYDGQRIAYLSAFLDGAYVLNVDDPTDPVQIAHIPSAIAGVTPVYEVTAAGRLIFLAENSTELRIFDVSDPSDPISLDSFIARGATRDVEHQNGVVYMAFGADQFGETPGVEAAHITLLGFELSDVGLIPEPGRVLSLVAALGALSWLTSMQRSKRRRRDA